VGGIIFATVTVAAAVFAWRYHDSISGGIMAVIVTAAAAAVSWQHQWQ